MNDQGIVIEMEDALDVTEEVPPLHCWLVKQI
jgi:hypothetical protein